MNSRFYIFAFLSISFLTMLWLASLSGDLTRVSAESGVAISAAKREEAYRANNLGVAQLEQYNHKAGADEFKRALEIDPQLKIAQINLAIALFNAQDLDGALQAANLAAANSPAGLQPQYILGLIAKSQNRTDDAVNAFTKVLQADREDVGANVNLGQIYIQQRKYAEAVNIFRVKK